MQNANGETISSRQSEFDPIRWALLNPWLSEGQPDNRDTDGRFCQRSRRNTIRSARLREAVSSGDVQKVVASETRINALH